MSCWGLPSICPLTVLLSISLSSTTATDFLDHKKEFHKSEAADVTKREASLGEKS
jgi:hypothetical protein